jgi:hypothetical protein
MVMKAALLVCMVAARVLAKIQMEGHLPELAMNTTGPALLWAVPAAAVQALWVMQYLNLMFLAP